MITNRQYLAHYLFDFFCLDIRATITIDTPRNKTIGYFMTQWICFERFLYILATLRGIEPKNLILSSPRVLSKLGLFDDNLTGEIDHIRRIRNYLVHGVEIPDFEYITSAGQFVERIMKSLLENPEEEVRRSAKEALESFK